MQPKQSVRRAFVILMSFMGIILIARTQIYYDDLVSSGMVVALALAVILTLYAVYCWYGEKYFRILQYTAKSGIARALPYTLLVLVLITSFESQKFNLLVQTEKVTVQKETYDWIVNNISTQAQFVTPPELAGFRLGTGRAIVVDLKALPFGALNIIEWYDRLENISGTHKPATDEAVTRGYENITEDRLVKLKSDYDLDYALLHTRSLKKAFSWPVVYSNGTYVILDLQRK